jgi:hypothetical protein
VVTFEAKICFKHGIPPTGFGPVDHPTDLPRRADKIACAQKLNSRTASMRFGLSRCCAKIDRFADSHTTTLSRFAARVMPV